MSKWEDIDLILPAGFQSSEVFDEAMEFLKNRRKIDPDVSISRVIQDFLSQEDD